MNKVILIGRLTRDPEIRYSQSAEPLAIASFSLAVDRKFKKSGEQNVDFINCKAFGKSAEFAEKYLKQGIKIAIEGKIQTGSYTNKDGQKVYTTDVIVEIQEFVESKKNNEGSNSGNSGYTPPAYVPSSDGFINIPEGLDEELPFN